MLVVGLLVLVARRMLGNYLVDNFVEVEQNRDIGATVWAIATSLLRDIGWNIVAVAVVLVLAAVLGGPSRPARAIGGSSDRRSSLALACSGEWHRCWCCCSSCGRRSRCSRRGGER